MAYSYDSLGINVDTCSLWASDLRNICYNISIMKMRVKSGYKNAKTVAELKAAS